MDEYSATYSSGLSFTSSKAHWELQTLPDVTVYPSTSVENLAGLSKAIVKLAITQSDMRNELEQIKSILATMVAKSTPSALTLNSLGSEKLSLRKPLVLSASLEDEMHHVLLEDINVWGEGDTQFEAIADFVNAFEEKYFILKKAKGKVAPHLKREWAILAELIGEKSK